MTIQQGAAIALAIAGGVVAWFGGRRILRHSGDPLFVDRLFAHRITMIRIYTLMLIPIGILAARYAIAAFALFFLSIAVGGFSARKQLYEETWTLPQYLLNRARMILFAGGLWIAVLCAPMIVERTGIGGGGVLLAVLIVAFLFYHKLLLLGLNSEPLRDAALVERFAPILAKSTAPRPRLYEGGPRTGRFTNAIALPRGKQSRVVFTRALLRDLEPNEVAAIFAHELAHIEHYAKKRSRIRTTLGAVLLPLLAVAPQVVVLMNDPKDAVWVSVAWPIVFLTAAMSALVNRQKHEGEADLRALELGADPLALISGLEKLHQRNRVPKRFDAKREQRMTHPSVARRVAAIRRAAGLVQEAAPAFPREFGDIRFTENELQVRGVAYRYDALQSLALRKTLRGFALVGRSGRKTLRVPVDPAAAAGVNTTLDWCDGRLAPPPDTTTRAPREARLVALLVLLMSFMPGIPFPPLVMAIVGLIVPTTASMAALGATAIAAGIAALLKPGMPFIGEAVRAFAAAEILMGIFALVMSRRVPRAGNAKAPLITLAIPLALILIPAAITFHPQQPGLQLYVTARSMPSIAVLLIGIAAALAVSGRKRVSIAVAAAAIAFVGCGTRAFAHISGSDPLLTDRKPMWVRAPAPLSTATVPKVASKLRISPDARQIAALWSHNFDEDFDEGGTFGVGPLGGKLQDVKAQDVRFLGDRVFRLTQTDSGVELTDGLKWTVRLPTVAAAQLSIDNGIWRVSGVRPQNWNSIAYTGRIGSTAYAVDPARHVYAAPSLPPLVRIAPMAAMLTLGSSPTEFWRDRQRIGRTVFTAYDVAPFPASELFAVVGYDASSTYVATVEGSAIHATGTLPGRARRIGTGSRSRLALVDSDGQLVVWNLRSGKAMRINDGNGIVADAAFADRDVAVLRGFGNRFDVAIYSTDSLE